MVRDALVWLGEADCCRTVETLRANEPRLTGARAVILHWADVFGTETTAAFTVRSVVERALERIPNSANPEEPGPLRYPDLRDALLTVAGSKGRIDNKRLGDWLRGVQNRIIDGYRFVHPETGGSHDNVAKWRLERITGDDPA